MEHFYAIPTHREIDDKNLNDYFREVDYAIEILKKDVSLIIFEDTNGEINKEKIIKFKNEFNKVPVIYITRKNVMTIYDIIKSELSLEASKAFSLLYPSNNVNYGNVFNRIFLFAILYGGDYIHRRDSDILIDYNKDKPIYPIINEIRYLGSTKNNKIIYILGGGYKGKYNLDIDSLILENNDYTLVKKLFSSMSIPEEYHDDIVNEEIIGNNVAFKKDIIDFDSKSYPECGNISIYKLQEYFPSSSQDFIIGSDYFFIDVSVHTKLNVTYHNRAVIHKHTKDRNINYIKVYNYWRGILMLIDSQIFYRNFYEKYLDSQDFNFLMGDENLPIKISADMKKFLVEFKKKYSNFRIEKMKDFLDTLYQSNDQNIKEISLKLSSECYKTINTTNKEIKNHILLMKNWNLIISEVKKIKQQDKVQDLLKSFIID